MDAGADAQYLSLALEPQQGLYDTFAVKRCSSEPPQLENIQVVGRAYEVA
jgi:hypothetical protein